MASIDQYVIIGTRRWARVMAFELNCSVPSDKVINMIDDPSETSLKEWLVSEGLGTRISLIQELLPCPIDATGVAFVVNSAYLHRHAIENALLLGYSVVSEKPASLSKQETTYLVDLAKALGLQFFCTNTYLFATYLDSFKKEWIAGQHLKRMHICWSDPRAEIRHGMPKSYDSSIPILYDMLPHVANIIFLIAGGGKLTSLDLQVKRGGSMVVLQCTSGNLEISVSLERNANQRIRSIAIDGTNENILLDFSVEPGSISINQAPIVQLAPEWRHQLKPIALMILSVQNFFESGSIDPRLSPSAAIFGNELIDAIVTSYVDQQISFFRSYSGKKYDDIREPDFCYALKEATSIANRGLPYLSIDSPLRKLVLADTSLK
jgi:predicted dehydrogenase